jgi:putative transposase
VGLSAPELCRKHGISVATLYTWRKKYGGLEISEAKRLKALEEENSKLKKLLAESMMNVSTLHEMLGKKASDARLEEGRRELGHPEQGILAAPRLWPRGHRSARLPLPFNATR